MHELFTRKQYKEAIITAYNLKGNGISERINQMIIRILRHKQDHNLKPTLDKVDLVLQNQHNHTLGYLPMR